MMSLSLLLLDTAHFPGGNPTSRSFPLPFYVAATTAVGVGSIVSDGQAKHVDNGFFQSTKLHYRIKGRQLKLNRNKPVVVTISGFAITHTHCTSTEISNDERER